MSFNVHVNARSIKNKSGGNMLITSSLDPQDEFQKRRRIRLEQVRQQSKRIANNVNNKVRRANEKLPSAERKKKENNEKLQVQKLLQLEQQFLESLNDIGIAHLQAAEIDDEETIAQQKRKYKSIAQKRGEEAKEKLQIEKNEKAMKKSVPVQQKKFTRAIEDTRSKMVTSLNKNNNFKRKRRSSSKPDDEECDEKFTSVLHFDLSDSSGQSSPTLNREKTKKPSFSVFSAISEEPTVASGSESSCDSAVISINKTCSEQTKKRREHLSGDQNETLLYDGNSGAKKHFAESKSYNTRKTVTSETNDKSKQTENVKKLQTKSLEKKSVVKHPFHYCSSSSETLHKCLQKTVPFKSSDELQSKSQDSYKSRVKDQSNPLIDNLNRNQDFTLSESCKLVPSYARKRPEYRVMDSSSDSPEKPRSPITVKAEVHPPPKYLFNEDTRISEHIKNRKSFENQNRDKKDVSLFTMQETDIKESQTPEENKYFHKNVYTHSSDCLCQQANIKCVELKKCIHCSCPNVDKKPGEKTRVYCICPSMMENRTHQDTLFQRYEEKPDSIYPLDDEFQESKFCHKVEEQQKCFCRDVKADKKIRRCICCRCPDKLPSPKESEKSEIKTATKPVATSTKSIVTSSKSIATSTSKLINPENKMQQTPSRGKYVQVPTKPTVTLMKNKSTMAEDYYARDPSREVQHYDDITKYSGTYAARDDFVQRIPERDITVGMEIESEKTVKKKLNRQDKDATARGLKAAEKEKVRRDYEEIMKKLPALQKKERMASIAKDKTKYHMSEDRKRQFERKKENDIENAYEKSFPKPATITLPKKYLKDVDKVPYRVVDMTKDTKSVNLATWDVNLEGCPCEDGVIYSKTVDCEVNTEKTITDDQQSEEKLKQILQKLLEQRKKLDEEVANIPKDSKLHQILEELNCDFQQEGSTTVRFSSEKEVCPCPEEKDTVKEYDICKTKEDENVKENEQIKITRTISVQKKSTDQTKDTESCSVRILQNMCTQTVPSSQLLPPTKTDSACSPVLSPCTCPEILKHPQDFEKLCHILKQSSSSEKLCQIVIKIGEESTPPEIYINSLKSKDDNVLVRMKGPPDVKNVENKEAKCKETRSQKSLEAAKASEKEKNECSNTESSLTKKSTKKSVTERQQQPCKKSQTTQKVCPSSNEKDSMRWKDLLNQNSICNGTTSTSYMSPPEFKKDNCNNSQKVPRTCETYINILREKPQQGNLQYSSPESREASAIGKPCDSNLLFHIKRLLKMSHKTIEELTVSTVSTVSTPDSSIINIESNKAISQLQNICKSYNLKRKDLEKILSSLSSSSSPSSVQSTVQSSYKSCSESAKNEERENCTCPPAQMITSVVQTEKEAECDLQSDFPDYIQQVYQDLASKCVEKIESLSALIEKLRNDKQCLLKPDTNDSDKENSTKYLDFAFNLAQADDKNECIKKTESESSHSVESTPEQDSLTKKLLEIDVALTEKIKTINKLDDNAQNCDAKVVDVPSDKSDNSFVEEELIERFRRLVYETCAYEKEDNNFDECNENKNTRVSFSDEDNFVPLLCGISSLPKWEIKESSDECLCSSSTNSSKNNKPPPSRGLYAARRFNDKINNLPHELSSITEVDSLCSSKLHRSKSPEVFSSKDNSPIKEECSELQKPEIPITEGSPSKTSQTNKGNIAYCPCRKCCKEKCRSGSPRKQSKKTSIPISLDKLPDQRKERASSDNRARSPGRQSPRSSIPISIDKLLDQRKDNHQSHSPERQSIKASFPVIIDKLPEEKKETTISDNRQLIRSSVPINLDKLPEQRKENIILDKQQFIRSSVPVNLDKLPEQRKENIILDKQQFIRSSVPINLDKLPEQGQDNISDNQDHSPDGQYRRTFSPLSLDKPPYCRQVKSALNSPKNDSYEGIVRSEQSSPIKVLPVSEELYQKGGEVLKKARELTERIKNLSRSFEINEPESVSLKQSDEKKSSVRAILLPTDVRDNSFYPLLTESSSESLLKQSISSSSSTDLESVEIMLQNMGMGWALATLRKTKQALALTSSSSSTDINQTEKYCKTSEKSSSSEISLKEFMEKQLQNISSARASSNASKHRTSTPINRTAGEKTVTPAAIFSGDSDLSSVKTNSRNKSSSFKDPSYSSGR